MHSTRCYSLLGSTVLPMALALLVAVSLTACDQGAQNFDYTSGSNLTVNVVSDDASLTIPNYDSTTTVEYQVEAFTTNQDYSWEVANGTLDNTRRGGENAVVATSSPAMTVTVTTTVDGEEVSGSAGGTDYPTFTAQTEKYNKLSRFGNLLATVGLASPLNSDAPLGPNNPDFINGWTAFAPSNTALLNALDADGNGEIGDDELPSSGVLAKVLQYHVLPDSLTSTEIEMQSAQTLLHPEETLGLNGSAGTVEGANQTVSLTTPDIATTDGVLHAVDGVLLPASVVSINMQTVSRDTVNNVDTVAVAGAYVADGGFIALHDSTRSGDIIGVSEKLSPGFHGNEAPIKIALDSQLSDTTGVVAMPHRDNPLDGQFTFDDPVGGDPPYFRGDSNVPVVDSASVAPPQ